MGRMLIALFASVLAWGPAGLEASRGRAYTDGGHGVFFESASGRFSLARGVVAGSVVGMVDLAFAGTSSAICFLPGTFDVTIDGVPSGDPVAEVLLLHRVAPWVRDHPAGWCRTRHRSGLPPTIAG